jgi:hypothetical protein
MEYWMDDEVVKSRKRLDARHSGEGRNPVISDNYENTGSRSERDFHR